MAEPKPATNIAWIVFAIAIVIFVIAIIWSVDVTSKENNDPVDAAKQVQRVTFLWFSTLAALFVGLFLCLCPVPLYIYF
uniref:Transmembrane protein n=1 Tax=Pithovirus LCPAC403 TaxID=2506596 RepID=A0A481ZED2_9VIRU|nr:MAG: hypothetical protein LCPAC403_01250 [Pithovirus LCPAC403]